MRFWKIGLAVAMTALSAAAAEEGVSDREIYVGTTNALSGPLAVSCGAVTTGARAYLNAVNDKGGVNGRKIKFEILDDAYAPQRAIGNVRRLISQDKVFALFSGCGTATGSAVLNAIASENVPYLFPLVGLEAMTQPPRKNVFSLLPPYGVQAPAILEYAANGKGLKTAALVIVNIAGSDQWVKIVKDKLSALGISVVDEQLFDVAAPDKAPFVTQAKSKTPDLVFMIDSSAGAAKYLLEMQRQSWRPKLVVGVNTLADESFLRAAGASAEGMVVAASTVVPANDAAAGECNAALAALDKSLEPTSYTTWGCMTAKVFVDALRRTGKEPTREKLVAELEKTSGFETGVGGAVSFGPASRQGLQSMKAVGVKDGKFTVLPGVVPLR